MSHLFNAYFYILNAATSFVVIKSCGVIYKTYVRKYQNKSSQVCKQQHEYLCKQ